MEKLTGMFKKREKEMICEMKDQHKDPKWMKYADFFMVGLICFDDIMLKEDSRIQGNEKKVE